MPNQLLHRERADIDHKFPYLDGIRGSAILLVASGHFFLEIYFFKISWIGLNLFFVLSGYLITRSLFQFRHYSTLVYLRNFYARRILRIFPLYYGVLIFFFFVLPLMSHRLQLYYAELDNIQSAYWLYTSNWNMITNDLPKHPIFFHFWSLAVEEQFYFVWPVLFILCNRSRSLYILIGSLLILSIVNRINTDIPLHAYLSSLTAAEPLLLGCLLSILQKDGILNRITKQLNVAALFAAIFLCIVFLRDQDLHITNEWLMKYGYTAINIIIMSVIAAVLSGHNRGWELRSLFSMKWLRWLGKYSYSIYVFHWIILQTIVYKAQAILSANLWGGSFSYLAARIIGIALTLVISYYSYNFFEVRFLSLKKYFVEDKRWKWSFGRVDIFLRQSKPVRP